MGDIDRQALAGAISTGTHGTGPTLGSISTQVVGLRLALASGELVDCSPTQAPELFKAAQVSLGALGIITQVTLRCLPAYRLHERTWVAGFDECMAQLDEFIANNRHFEFFWVPSEDVCAMKTLNPTTVETLVSPNHPTVTGRLARYVREEKIDRSYRIFPSERNLKFNETEFAVPAANGPDCLREIRDLMQRHYPAVLWPIEYRTLAADDIPLSPAYGRATVTLSVHQAAELPYQPFFADVEAIFRNHQGRPHWGKIHTHTARELAAHYPAWAAFQTVRAEVDPAGLFLNEHLRTILLDA
jgi:FAD/FMN-containing dehydrogenase